MYKRQKGASPNYLIKVTRPDTLDEVEVKVEATKELFSDEMKEMEKLFNADVELRKKQIQQIESLKKSGVITASKFETLDLLSKKEDMSMRHGHRIMKACEEIPATLVRAEK